jgi:hypothetical protein
VHLLEALVDGFILVKLGFDLAIFLFGKENLHSSCLFHDIVGLKSPRRSIITYTLHQVLFIY